MFNIVSFSDDDILRWVNTDGSSHILPTIKIQVRGVGIFSLRTLQVSQFAKSYYRYHNLLSMPLENQGGNESTGFYWEKIIIEDQ
ncbi:leishmanolysin family protein, putative [Ichthyophthirius multifiliis]|uniref:Leishmanolysin family protein, putative n=1 Tax=Ichthyophthirius multifiliis TaxID=5932 RepID=G0R6M1_ICHMU|nr:leishmanolysin family protein, putative [Ichthyophthirius multifiliis]EGR26886.1 leishmanolysin family protein, putative [Ichthyophthirius multifiliis]|eukprot:XP_004023770.1 leishmanolysin family protein, putative [Ichthyophthirius multifiliis]